MIFQWPVPFHGHFTLTHSIVFYLIDRGNCELIDKFDWILTNIPIIILWVDTGQKSIQLELKEEEEKKTVIVRGTCLVKHILSVSKHVYNSFESNPEVCLFFFFSKHLFTFRKARLEKKWATNPVQSINHELLQCKHISLATYKWISLALEVGPNRLYYFRHSFW